MCPDTNPSILGFDEAYPTLAGNDEYYPLCAEYMDAYPCSDVLGFTPPGDDDSAAFYEPGDFPANGTATTFNVGGVINSPVSGAT